MPYAPMATDQSAEYLYKAGMNRAQGITGGLGAMLGGLSKTYEENKDFTAKNKAMENIIATHPEVFAPTDASGKPDVEKLQLFLQTDPNETLKQKYARISSFMEGTVLAKNIEKVKAATAVENAKVDEAKRELADNARGVELMRQWSLDVNGRGQGAGAGTETPDAGTQGATPSANVPSGASAIDPFLRQAALSTGLIPTTKNMPKLISEAGALRKAQESQKKAELAASVLYKDEDSAQAQADVFNNDPKNVGVVALVQPDPVRGGFAIKKQTTALRTPAQEAAAAGAVEEARITSKRAGDFNDQIAKDAIDAVQDRPRLQRIRELYKAGVQTGFGQDWATAAQSAMVGLGLGDAIKTGDKQELQALLEQDSLAKSQKYLKGGGSISNMEREQMRSISQSFGKVPSANLALINMTEAAYNKSEAAEKLRASLEDAGKSEREIASEIRKWVRAPENALSKFAPKGELPPAGTRVIQKGKIYESDGFTMKEVK